MKPSSILALILFNYRPYYVISIHIMFVHSCQSGVNRSDFLSRCTVINKSSVVDSENAWLLFSRHPLCLHFLRSSTQVFLVLLILNRLTTEPCLLAEVVRFLLVAMQLLHRLLALPLHLFLLVLDERLFYQLLDVVGQNGHRAVRTVAADGTPGCVDQELLKVP